MSQHKLEDINSELARRIDKRGLRFGVAIDGSNISDKATSLAASFTQAKRGDKLQIIHISDQTKTYLTAHLKPTHLKHYYEDLAAQHHISSEWLCREKEEGLTTCMSVTNLANKSNMDMLFVGSFGRKGEKLDMLGSVADASLRESHSSNCIVRSTGAKIELQATFMVAVDGSHASMIAFCMVASWLRRPRDIINVVMVTGSDGVSEHTVIEEYSKFMTAHKIPGKAMVKTIDRMSSTVPEGILDAITETESNVLVLGISGYGKKKLGSVSEDTVMQASCTTFIIKDGLEVMANRYSNAGSKSLASELCVPQS